MSFQPGERALIALKEADKRVALFKKPGIPTVKKNKEKKIILTEDSYIEVRSFQNIKSHTNYFNLQRNWEKSFSETSSQTWLN